jgi:2-dehydropantoate 2-reductase
VRIAIVGTGAMGSVYAGLLAAAGNEVIAIDRDHQHIAAIASNGLRVEGVSGDRVVRLRAVSDTEQVGGACDLVIVATKAGDVTEAAAELPPLLGADTPVLTIQNGLGSAERLAAVIDPARILIGVAGGFGASLRGPGHVHHNGMELIRLGELHGGHSARLAGIEGVWRDAGFTARGYDDIHQLIWEKFICNVTFSGPCALMHRTIGGVMSDPQAWRVALSCGLEAHAVGTALGVRFGFNDPGAYITHFGQAIPDARPSMLLDHLAGRRSEIDAINGMVPALARKLKLPSPVNDVVVDLIKGREAGFEGRRAGAR